MNRLLLFLLFLLLPVMGWGATYKTLPEVIND